MKKLLFLLLLTPSYVKAEFHYNDCVEITGGFFYQEEERIVDRVVGKEVTSEGVAYRIGSLFTILVLEKDLKKIDKSVCEEAENPKDKK